MSITYATRSHDNKSSSNVIGGRLRRGSGSASDAEVLVTLPNNILFIRATHKSIRVRPSIAPLYRVFASYVGK